MSTNPPAHLLRILRDTVPPEVGGPDPARLISGNPVHTTWNIEEQPGLFCGLWQSTPGCWRVEYDEWEFVHILEGHSVLTGDDGGSVELRAGDSWVIRPGFRGSWEVRETTLKEYVVRL